MPDINACGDVTGGVGDSEVSVNNVSIARGGCAVWLDDDTVMFNGPNAAGAWTLRTYNVKSWTFADVNALGANSIAAARGRYAAQAGGMLYASFPFASGSVMTLQGTDGRGAVGRNGEIALCDTPDCTSFTVYLPDGRSWSWAAAAYSLEILGFVQAIWNGGEVGFTCKTSVALRDRRVATVADETWIVGWNDAVGLVAQVNGASDGYILETLPICYHFRAKNVDGQLYVCWATNPQETPDSIVTRVVDRSLPRVPIVLPTQPAVTFHFEHPVIVAPFKDPEGTSGATHEVCVNQAQMSVARPHFVAEDSLVFGKGELLGIYTEHSDDPSSAVEYAEVYNTRVVVCRDAPGGWHLPSLRAWDVPARELYLVVGEAIDASKVRWAQEVRDLLNAWPGDVAVVPMFYCQGGAPPDETWPVSAVLDGLRELSSIVNTSPRVKLILPFEYQRANGIVGHAELQQAFDNLKMAAAVAGMAVLTPVGTAPEPPKPTSTFPLLLKGHHMRAYAKLNVEGAVAFVGCEPGTDKVYSDRTSGGAWEELEITAHEDSKLFDLKLVAANVQLSIQQNGSLETRPAGTFGAYEQFQVRTEDGTKRNVAYRADLIGPVLEIQVIQ